MNNPFSNKKFLIILTVLFVCSILVSAVLFGFWVKDRFDEAAPPPDNPIYREKLDLDAIAPVNANNSLFEGEWLINGVLVTIKNGEGQAGEIYIRIVESTTEINGTIIDYNDTPNVFYCIPRCVYSGLFPDGDNNYYDAHGNISMVRP